MKVAEVTVAIATLDRTGSLLRCLDAVLTGEVLPAEVLIVDQSRDESTRLALQQRQSPVQVTYVPQERLGLSASRNAGVARARCPIVAITDDDCVPAPGWIAAIVRAFASDPSPEAVTGRVLPLGPEQPGLYAVSLRASRIRSDYSGKVVPWQVGTGGNFAVKREWVDRVGGYDLRLGAGSPGQAAEDADLLYRLLCAGARIRYEPEALVYHERQSESRRMRSRWTYGHGVGALCALGLRRRDWYAVRMLGAWMREQTRECVRAVRHGQWRQVQERSLMLRGTLRGVLYGLSVR
jgi:GT2 family glycosyltransferase